MNTVRVWKDPEYRAELRRQDIAVLADNPAGVVELSDGEIEAVAGGTTWSCAITSAIVSVSLANCVCSTFVCGSCAIGTRGCC